MAPTELGIHPGPAGHHEHVHDADDRDAEAAHRERRGGIPFPSSDDRDVERPWSRREEQEPLGDETGERHADKEQGEVPPPLERRDGPDREQHQDREPPARAERVERAREGVEPPHAKRHHRVGDRGVEPIERPRVDVQPDAPRDDDEREQEEAEYAGRADLLRQRRRRSRWAPMAPAHLGHVDDAIGTGRVRVLFHRRAPS